MRPSSAVGRLAPSPTGGQHLGNARTFLINWLALRSLGGRLLLRIEDIDSPRVRPGATEQLLADLAWLGLDWEGSPTTQSQRLELYHAALQRLMASEKVYPCTCSRRDIELAASAPHAEHEMPRYPGTCAHRVASDAARLGRPFAWRFRGAPSPPVFTDVFAGVQELPEFLGGDFVVWKADGTPAYQLAVVVDDADQGITDVIRGNDLIPSTPRQLQLFKALGASPPRYHHVPLVKGADGLRLAKRHGEARLAAFRERGMNAESLLGWLAWSCGWLAEPLPVTAEMLVPLFRWDSIPREPWIVDPKLLARISA